MFNVDHFSIGMDGMFGGTFGQAGAPGTGFNYFPGNGDYSTWGNSAPMSRKPHYDEYYRHGDAMYAGMYIYINLLFIVFCLVSIFLV